MAGLHLRYQANTVKTRRVLSFHYLGLRGYVDKRLILLSEHYVAAVLNLRTMISDNFNGWIFVGIPQSLTPLIKNQIKGTRKTIWY